MQILCPEGHIVGEITNGTIRVKHRGRTITVKPSIETITTICCDRCGKEIKILGENDAQIEKTIDKQVVMSIE